jgi:uncharacterized GH25 family protein
VCPHPGAPGENRAVRVPSARTLSVARAVRAVAALACAAGLAVPADAHEFWIEPERFAAAPGETVGVGLAVGAGWPGERFALQTRRVLRFAWIDARGERPFDGGEGDDPAGRATAGAPGTAWAVYRSTEAVADIDAATFALYLREEGLEHVQRTREAQGRADAPVRERFSRCAKALVTVEGTGAGRPRGPDPTRPVGLDLEIVPGVDPRTRARGGALPVRVLWQGRPAPGLLVKALARDDPAGRATARTDARGRAVLRVPAGGVWLVNAVRIEAAAPGDGADWRSTWSSLTFEARTGAAADRSSSSPGGRRTPSPSTAARTPRSG